MDDTVPVSGCPCGNTHAMRADLQEAFRRTTAGLPPEVKVQAPPGAGVWLVPRLYIACHGLKAADLPALAAAYGFARAQREIRQVRIDRVTGDTTIVTEVVDDDGAGAAARFAALKESLPDMGPDATGIAHVLCNGCGTTAEVDFERPVLPAGWVADADGDFCPRCHASN
jgi:hypothetical protein